MQKTNILIFHLLFIFAITSAQTTVTGTVLTADNNESVPGISVVVRGTTNGVLTDFNGNYSIETPKDAVLVFSSLGFKKQEIPVNNNTLIDVSLETEINILSEVVVVGYGTQRKGDLTGAISTISVEAIEKRQVATIDQALQGQMAGVDVTVNSGTPGGGVMIRVRGVGTLNGTQPLFVVDGMMVDDIDYLNTNDIANIQVLKDASATAIYGARGANGVVIISTKKGSNGQSKINFSTYYGLQQFWRTAPILGSKDWAILNNEAKIAAGVTPYPSLNDPSTLTNTDWFEEITNKTAAISNYYLSISGATKKSNYFVSGGYMKQEGIVKKSDFERISLRVNTIHQPKKWLEIGENISLVKTNQRKIYEEDEWTNILISAMNMDPTTPVRNPDGTFSKSRHNDINNPLADIEYTNDVENNYRAIGNVYAEIGIFNDLKFKSNFSLEYSFGINDSYNPVYFVSPTQQNEISRIGKDNYSNFVQQWSNTLTYSKLIGAHNLVALLGTESYNYHSKFDGLSANDIPNDDPDVRYIDNANGRNQARVYGSGYETKQLSVLARVNYNYNGKYLVTANFRTDGSSKFSKAHQWGYFPSFSAGWKINEENFLNSSDIVSDLKLRVGWGQIGNQGSIPAYQSVTTATTGQNYVWGDVLIPGIAFQSTGNNKIKWETSTTTNLGLDFGFFKDRIHGSVEYFIKNTTDMLLQVPVPGQSGLQEAPWQNAGEMKNTGIELSLGYKNRDHELKYSFGLNFSTVKNEVISLGSGNEFIDGGIYRDNYYVTRTVVGQPIAQFYGHKTDGLFQNQAEVDAQTAQTDVAPGDVRYVDADNDGQLDFTFLGSPLPDFTYSLNADFAYKNFDFNFVLQGVQGNKIFNGTTYYNRSSSAYWNLNTDMLNRWTGEGSQTNALYPRMNASDSNNSMMSDRFIEDGSYLRVKTLQLGYTLPDYIFSKENDVSLRMYLNAQNLFTFTKYTGLDPEIGEGQQGALDLGIDRAFYPQARLFSLGFNLIF